MAQVTFGQFVADTAREVDNANSRTDWFIREATVRQLEELSHKRINFMEAFKDFQLVIGQEEYSLNYPGSLPDGFPRDLQDVDVLTVLYGTTSGPLAGNPPPPSPDPGEPLTSFNQGAYGYVIEQVPLRVIRQLTTYDIFSSWPLLFAWHHRSLILDRKPATATWMRLDYVRDGRLDDTTSGEILPTGTDGFSNPWFGRGRNALRASVLAEYHLSISKDVEAAQMYGVQAKSFLSSIISDVSQDRGNLQAAWEL